MRSSRSPRPRPAAGSGTWLTRIFRGLDLRTGVMMGLIVTYLWRFQDLAPVLAPLRIALALSLVAIAIMAFQPNGNALGRALRRPHVVLFILWTIWLGIGVNFALDQRLAWLFWSDYHLTNVVMFVFVMSTLSSLASIRLAVAAHLIGVSVITFYYIRQGFPTDWTPLAGVDRNDLALMFNLATPLAVFYALTEKRRGTRWAAWGLAGIVALSTILTQSRGGFLTVAVVVIFLSFRVRHVKFYRRLIPLTAFTLGLILLPQDVKDRLSTILETEEDYNRTAESGRVPIWIRGIGYMADRPLFGVGMDNFPVAEATLALEARTLRSWRGHAAHNIFVQAGAESGAVGLVMFVAMIVAAIVSLNRTRARLVRRKAPEAWILLGDLLTASFLAYCVGGFFLSWPYSPFLLFLMALVTGYEYCEGQIVAVNRGRRRPVRKRRRVTRPAPRAPASAPLMRGVGR